jgi:two-component system CheB/CheR fusion protein
MAAARALNGATRARDVGVALATAAAYVAAAKLGLSLAFEAAQVTTVWPPTGIAIAALLLLGPRAWPGVTLGAFLANVTADEPVLTAVGIALGNTLEAVSAAWCLRRVAFRPPLARLRDALALALLGAAASTIHGATIGAVSLCAGGVQPWSLFGPIWWTWWVGDALGALVVAPFLLVWTTPSPARAKGDLLESAALLLGTLSIGIAVFVVPRAASLSGYPLHYVVFPLVIWAAMRFGPRGTATVTLLVSAFAIWNAVGGTGPLAPATAHERLLQVQLYMAVVAVTGLFLAAAIAEHDVVRQQADADLHRLRVSEKRLRLALDAGRMGVWDWDIGTGVIEWSDNLEEIHGLAPGSFPGTFEGFRAIVHPDDRARVEQAIARAVETGTGYDVEFRNVRDDGTVGWVSAKGRVVHDPTGPRMIGVGVDVTEAKRLAGELEVRAGELALADRRKDEFLAMLAHELRNPMAPLTMALHLLRSGAGDRHRALEIAERQAQQLARLVDDLLDASRITQGKITLHPEPALLDDVVQRAVETARPAIDARGHRVDVVLPAVPVRLLADRARLAQVLANLLDNAAKYTPPGGSITLLAERTADGVALRVRDTGAGLPPELMPNLFDLFVQGDRSLARSRGGLGIGLTIVRRLVELHGGRVEAHSDGPGLGSEFVIHLPAAADVAAAPPSRAGAPATAAPSRRILVVEDQHDAAEVLATVAESWGHEVRVAHDAVAALAIVDEWAPDIVISDLGLPRVDGYALARALRDRPGGDVVTMIALSGYGREQDKQAAVDAGFDHHLVKPPDLTVLGDLIARAPAAEPRAAHANA